MEKPTRIPIKIQLASARKYNTGLWPSCNHVDFCSKYHSILGYFTYSYKYPHETRINSNNTTESV